MDEFVFDAFISYSHRDLQWGRWLQKKLEGLPVPEDLAPGRAGRRRLRIFRDQTDLAGAELQSSLERELKRSRYLIVICSPASAASRWVNEEIRCFCALGRKDRIIPFIVSGEPMSDRPGQECFPPMLRGPETNELLGVNIQEIGRKSAFLKVASVLLEVRFNRLVDREKRRLRRSRIIFGSAAAAAILVTGVLLWQNNQLKEDNDQLTFDIYGAAMTTLQRNETLQPGEIAFLESSARQGNGDAMFYLAYCYQDGFGVQQDPEQAFLWYRKAADQGNTQGMIGLAHCYEEGFGTEANSYQFIRWLFAAAEAGNPEAMLKIGVKYVYGNGVPLNPELGVSWIRKATELRYPDAMMNLALAYMNGTGVEQDYHRAMELMTELAEMGDATAQFLIGSFYMGGQGVDYDFEKAYAWFMRAALSGHSAAMYWVGWCIENHCGVDNPALFWYQKAAEAGEPDALKRLRQLSGEAEPAESPVPTEDVPAEDAPAESPVPTEDAPTVDAPAESPVPTEGAPTEGAPAEDAPTEGAPAEDAPTESPAPTEQQ